MERRERWLEELIEATQFMLWGSLQQVYRRCGRPNCHCATGEKHGPAFYLSRSEAGRSRMIYVPDPWRADVERGVAAYRRYRELGKHLAAANERGLGLGRKRGRR